MNIAFFLIFSFIAVISALIGFFIFSSPALAIQIQKKFYQKINWRIEPISMPKEIRNTKIMGLFLLAMAVLVLVYLVIRKRLNLF
jgi:hypothetical protein